MGDRTRIEWCDATWNPIRGCSRVSSGCMRCYAERAAIRQKDAVYRGLVKSTPAGPRWTGEVRFVEDALTLPLQWKMPRRVFVNSMSDLFHEAVRDEWLDRVFAVMALASRHTFLCLTKRAEAARRHLGDPTFPQRIKSAAGPLASAGARIRPRDLPHVFPVWPLPNVWLGVSVENQAAADERIPLLLQTPAAVRFVSYEPALGPVHVTFKACDCLHVHGRDCGGRLDWVIIGGESGPDARPFDPAWARSTIAQCHAAGVPVFVKQMGRWLLGDHAGFLVNHWLLPNGIGFVPPIIGPNAHTRPAEAIGFSLWDRKGADPTEWAEDLRIREYPVERVGDA